jgi:hypothetical protein
MRAALAWMSLSYRIDCFQLVELSGMEKCMAILNQPQKHVGAQESG